MTNESTALPNGFLTQAEVDNADKRISAGEFADRDEALAAIAAERGANPRADQEAAAASFPPAEAAPSIGGPVTELEPVEEVADESEPEPETKGRRR